MSLEATRTCWVSVSNKCHPLDVIVSHGQPTNLFSLVSLSFSFFFLSFICICLYLPCFQSSVLSPETFSIPIVFLCVNRRSASWILISVFILVHLGAFLVFSHTPISLFCYLLFLVRNNKLKQENFCSLEFIVLSMDSKN